MKKSKAVVLSIQPRGNSSYSFQTYTLSVDNPNPVIGQTIVHFTVSPTPTQAWTLQLIGTDINGTLGNGSAGTSSIAVGPFQGTSWLNYNPLLIEAIVGEDITNVVQLTTTTSTPPPSAPSGHIAVIAVRDNATGTEYIWSNGSWSTGAPIVTPGAGNLIVGATIANNGTATGNLTVTIQDSSGNTLLSRVVSLQPSESTGINTGDLTMPDSAYSVTITVNP
jgi:hypothetical protein